jgi:multimeric flavodoxin WrbA
MNITGICASPRGDRSRTLRLVRGVLSGVEDDGAETVLIDIGRRTIGFCTACEACITSGSCVIDDDFNETLAELAIADGVVLGSPVYIDNVTAQMKAFADRCADAIHYQALWGKYGCSVSTTWESGGDGVVAYMDHVLQYLGAQTIPGLSVALHDDETALVPAEAATRELGRCLASAICSRPLFPGQQEFMAGNRACFAGIVAANRECRPEEYERWVQRGWIGSGNR